MNGTGGGLGREGCLCGRLFHTNSQSGFDILHEDTLMLIWDNKKKNLFFPPKKVLFYLHPYIASFLNVLSLCAG